MVLHFVVWMLVRGKEGGRELKNDPYSCLHDF